MNVVDIPPGLLTPPGGEMYHERGTFPVMTKSNARQFGEIRSRAVVLDLHDAMTLETKPGMACQTRLEPRAADARAAHPDTRHDSETAQQPQR